MFESKTSVLFLDWEVLVEPMNSEFNASGRIIKSYNRQTTWLIVTKRALSKSSLS